MFIIKYSQIVLPSLPCTLPLVIDSRKLLYNHFENIKGYSYTDPLLHYTFFGYYLIYSFQSDSKTAVSMLFLFT